MYRGEAGLGVDVWSVNNHQTTFGVLGAAVEALLDCMRTRGEWGGARFEVYDGVEMVGEGWVG